MLTRSQALDAMIEDLSVTSGSGQTYTVEDPINRDSGLDPAYVFDFQYAGTSQPGDMSSPSQQYTGWTAFTPAEKVRFEAMLAQVEEYVNVDFQLVSGQADPTMNVGKVDLPGSTAGVGGYGYSVSISGSGVTTLQSFDNFVVFDNTIPVQSGQDNLLLHEVMHALTLKHPFDGDTVLPPAFENNKYSVLSYTSNPDNGAYSDGLQIYDVLAAQYRWGANMSTATGNDSYTGKRNTTVDAVWDAGGTDHFDASGRTNDVVLSLVEATFSSFDSTDDVVITYDTVIENATGGSGNDEIIGNGAYNLLSGGDGNDTIDGGSGRDTVYGSVGDDRLDGGNANDKLYGGSGRDTMDGGVSNDKLYGGSGNDTMDGGFGNDLMFGGNSRDRMDGGNGDDTIFGGNGNDTIQGRSGEDEIHGDDGADFLVGGKGDDDVWGGGDRDVFHYDRNGDNDTIHDFENNFDTLELDNFGFSTVAEALSFADQVGSDVVFDFGSGDTLTILGMNVSGLQNDLDVV